MIELPAPLVPADCDLTDFPFLPLVVARLRSSKAWLKCKRRPELAFYLINLWTASWHERPAASLEDDDDVLADKAMCSPAQWDELREEILRGWVKCSDGRLYHPVVAEKALEAWEGKLKQRWKTYCAALKKSCQRKAMSFEPPEFDEWLSQGQPHRVSGTNASCHGDKDDGDDQGDGDNAGSPPGNAIQGKEREKERGKGTGTERNLFSLPVDPARMFEMTADWSPQANYEGRICGTVIGGMPVDAELNRFRSYWIGKGRCTESQWVEKLIADLKNYRTAPGRRAGARPQPAPQVKPSAPVERM